MASRRVALQGVEHPDLEPVSFHLRGDDLEGSYVVRYTDGRNAIVRIDGREAVVSTNRRLTPRRYRLMPRRSELGDVAIEARSRRPRSAYRLPEGEVVHRAHPGFYIALATIFLVLFGLGLWTGLVESGTDAAIVGLLAAFVTLVIGSQLQQGRHTYKPFADGREHPLSTLVDRDYDERAGIAIVDEVKSEYGRLLSDVVYRVEHSALFDPSTPTTRAFTELMVRWDNDRARLRADERQQLAADVRVAFDTARAHAERVGLDHLPRSARDRAGVAAKALRLAADKSTSAAERRAATERASDILGSLMLYYLPQVDEVEQLLGGRTPKALPGRRTAGRG